MKISNIYSKRFSKVEKISFLLLVTSICNIGCEKVDAVKNENENKVVQVYCGNCGYEFDQKTNYCPDCGSKGIWLDKKPQLSKSTKNISKNNKVSEYKYEYLAKINDLDEELEKSKSSLIEEESVYSQIDIEKNKFETWDNMLNEIYCLLAKELNEEEFTKIKDTQDKWLNNRERIAESDFDKFQGMVFANVQYNSTLAKLTKERCYELVNDYL